MKTSIRLLAGVSLVAGGVVLGYGVLAAYRAPGPLGAARAVLVPRGRFADVAAVLERGGVVQSGLALRGFEALTRWQGPVRAAELSFPAGASIERVLLVLRHGRPVQHLLTVPEGIVAARLGEALAGAPGLTGDVEVPEEGTFLPESYAYEWGMSARSVALRAVAAFRLAAGEAWAGRAAGLPLRSERELVLLASLVERETHLAAERPLVARVFLNRLKLGMRLQSDPTAVYPASGGFGTLPYGLRRDELEAASPYNTYVVTGLPAGAICEPGLASIKAAAHPADSDALYFVADGSGGHVFARTLDEHVRNVARSRGGR
jgi:UPF0755 protein